MFPVVFLSLLSGLLAHGLHLPVARSPDCESFYAAFSGSTLPKGMVAVGHGNTYEVSSGGLQMYLDRPEGEIRTKGGENDKIADGATFNSTFSFMYGKVTYELSAPTHPGVVTAAILIADEGDEMDVELLGSDSSHFQSNIFAPRPHDDGPLYGVFSSVDSIPRGSTEDVHTYSIDWNAERIIWSVDGEDIRTLKKGRLPLALVATRRYQPAHMIYFRGADQTMYHGTQHFPSHPTRIQLGIWDASSPAGTAAWARGPIDWKTVPRRIGATVKSVKLECH
ncbi:concanavalin A-like lectin/glucanase [Gloeophyllum trabeum ATCC 11539]|uniref:Concanavalin A-like lectin/glucanase n=1 Tax=Gloeophyllum trabeum (strain ATCC 11539 / FP-39264 / Madison 617) TaxID=670483 RepID=S7QBF8_GLOTA|nr:concanavalin A-like lectin/glucanase [Gloeophyllum trabeum ATCC 11539]EPQ56687.1 concanavalin A-like lectin/glucanase [Gloeophyllum trabeum ATCC 11539]